MSVGYLTLEKGAIRYRYMLYYSGGFRSTLLISSSRSQDRNTSIRPPSSLASVATTLDSLLFSKSTSPCFSSYLSSTVPTSLLVKWLLTPRKSTIPRALWLSPVRELRKPPLPLAEAVVNKARGGVATPSLATTEPSGIVPQERLCANRSMVDLSADVDKRMRL